MAKTNIDNVTREEALRLLFSLRDEIKIIKSDIRELRTAAGGIDGDRLMTTREVCYYLSISDRQLRRYRSDGMIEGVRIGAKLLYYKSEVIRFLADYVTVLGRYKG